MTAGSFDRGTGPDGEEVEALFLGGGTASRDSSELAGTTAMADDPPAGAAAGAGIIPVGTHCGQIARSAGISLPHAPQ